MVIYIITLKLNSTFGTIGKATGVKMTAKVVAKTQTFAFAEADEDVADEARLQDFEHLRLNETLLFNFLAYFFHLVSCIRKF